MDANGTFKFTLNNPIGSMALMIEHNNTQTFNPLKMAITDDTTFDYASSTTDSSDT